MSQRRDDPFGQPNLPPGPPPIYGGPSRPRPFDQQGGPYPASGPIARPKPYEAPEAFGSPPPQDGFRGRPSSTDNAQGKTPGKSTNRQSPTRIFVLLGLVVLLIGVLGGTTYLFFGQRGKSTAVGSEASTGGSTTGVPTVPGGTPGVQTPIAVAGAPTYPTANWLIGGPNFLVGFAFAAGSPRFGYGCGIATGQTTVSVTVTKDSWATWSTVNTTATYGATNSCQMSINPANVNDAVMLTTYADAKGLPSAHLWRTSDGGQSWKQLALPADSPVGAQGFAPSVAWAAGTLAVATNAATKGGAKTLAISANGGAFTWANETIAIQPPIIGLGTGLYITTVCTKSPCIGAYRSDDNGITWKPVIYAKCPTGFHLIAGGADSRTAFGTCPSATTPKAPPVISVDGGVSWNALPALPNQQDWNPNGLMTAPDGTTFLVATAVQGKASLFKLAPSAKTWQIAVDTMSTPFDNLWTATWNNLGQPVAIWSGRSVKDGATTPLPGLQYITPQ